MKSEGKSLKASGGRLPLGRTMTKRELVQVISQKKNIPATHVRSVVQAFLDGIIDTLASGNRLEFREFGVFEVVRRKQKTGRNPKKASVAIIIPAKNAVKFSPGKRMKKIIEREEE
jgi:nucleoid DNA-binding protein